jgi:methanogenic corrinoid protein MtbC1
VLGRERQLQHEDVDRFVALVLGEDDTAPRAFVREVADAGVATDDIYIDLLTPTAARLGELWESDDCDFVDVTIALGRMQRTLREISQVFVGTPDLPSPTGSALLTCIPGEQHTLGIVMIADSLIRDGWRVQVGAPWSDADLATLVRSESYDVLGVSLACESRIPQLRRQVSALRAASRNPGIRVLVGGQAFVGRADLLKRVEADGFAESLREIVPVARQLLTAGRG